MPLNKVKPESNMYKFCDATINFIKGLCPHFCQYCYARYMNNYPPKLDEKEFLTKLVGYKKTEVKDSNDLFDTDKVIIEKEITPITIFVGSSIDMFADAIPDYWISRVLKYEKLFPDNTYIHQTKNPAKMLDFIREFPPNRLIGITLETNIHYPSIMGQSPSPAQRWEACKDQNIIDFITIEPIMHFDRQLIKMIADINPGFINIGANTDKEVRLPEPDKKETLYLIKELKVMGYKVNIKSNLSRIIGDINL